MSKINYQNGKWVNESCFKSLKGTQEREKYRYKLSGLLTVERKFCIEIILVLHGKSRFTRTNFLEDKKNGSHKIEQRNINYETCFRSSNLYNILLLEGNRSVA